MDILKVVIISITCVNYFVKCDQLELKNLDKCKLSHMGIEFKGKISRTISSVPCQSWTAANPIHKINPNITNGNFSDYSMRYAKNYCRNPDRNPLGPWCYTIDPKLTDEECGVLLCRYKACKLTGPGMEYEGNISVSISGRECLKWNKYRKRVSVGSFIYEQPKFNNSLFSDGDIVSAKTLCRNPDGDLGGPWCFVENDNSNTVEKEHCDVPFCDEENCMVFAKNSSTHSHYTTLNETQRNFTFGIKLWDSDSYLNAEARIVLSVLALPLASSGIDTIKSGIEISISNKESYLSANDKNDDDPVNTNGILKSSRYTFFSVTWTRGYISLNAEGKIKPIFTSEYDTTDNLLSLNKNLFNFYSIVGTNILWSLPFCEETNLCEVHTTMTSDFTRFWLLRKSEASVDIEIHVRATHSAYVKLVPSPGISYPSIIIKFYFKDNFTRALLYKDKNAPETILAETQINNLLHYWKWTELSVTLFKDHLEIFWTRDVGTQLILESENHYLQFMRWFSIGSDDTTAHWTLYCLPQISDLVPRAILPECAFNAAETNYRGTQSIDAEGHTCLPWVSSEYIPKKIQKNDLFPSESILKAWNYCRDPDKENKGTYCYSISVSDELKVQKSQCNVRKCMASECRLAGTGNDYIGKMNVTRTNRTCQKWVQNIPHRVDPMYLNDTLFPDQHYNDAENYCRDPSKDLSGSWCYTTDPNVERDVCDVKDCEKLEANIVLMRGNGVGHKKESSNGVTIVYRCMWKLSKGKKIEVAMRVLKQEFYDKHLKEFMSRAGDWASLRDGSKGLVRLWGVTLAKPSALVLEYCRHGSLTQYLHQCKTGMCNPVQSVDLLEAASHIASALWHMQEQGIVHGKIRCRKVLVYMHNEDSFVVKLADPGIQSLYGFEEIHWIPIECYSNFEYVKHSVAADVWAFGTTLWEIYMYGETIPKNDHHTTMMFYSSGKRLPQPVECPDDIYKIMLDCWDPDQHKRIKPQAIMRDINQLLYQVFNSRKKHPYATVFPKIFPDTASISTTMTEETVITQNDELLSVSAMNEVDSNLSISSGFSGGSVATTWLLNHSIDVDNNEDILSCDMSNILSNFHFGNTGSVDDISAIQTIFEIDASSNLVLQGRIGQGFYGEVFKGTLEGPGDSEPRQVAVKKLKTNALSTGLQDFEREISIMKTLNHPNIVKIFTVIDDPEISLIMEYVPHGSLQSYLKIYKESLTTKQLLNYASDVAKGMDYLAHKHIVHRDLAARNILVVDKNHVKISDFGLAQVVGKNEYYILQTNRDLPIKWYAPESLRDGKFSTKSDVWSFGVTMYEMFSHGEEPKLPMIEDSNGQEQQKLLNALESGARFLCPPTCPQSVFVRIMYPCWQKSPNERPSFHQLVSDIEDLLPQF